MKGDELMCGRFEFMLEAEDIAKCYQLEMPQVQSNGLFQKIEVFPNQPILVVGPKKQVQVFKWGLMYYPGLCLL